MKDSPYIQAVKSAGIDPVHAFEQIKELITAVRRTSAEEGIAHPKITLGTEWTWLLLFPTEIAMIKRMTKAESLSIVRPEEAHE